MRWPRIWVRETECPERFMPGAFDGLEGKEVPVTCAGRPIGVAKLHVDDTGLHAEIVRK